MTRTNAAIFMSATMIMFVATSPIGGLVGQTQQAAPGFRAGVDLVTIDVQIAPFRDSPIREFRPSDFAVRISGQARPAVSATLLHHDEGAVSRDPPRDTRSTPTCTFAFHRKKDLPTVHYLVGVEAVDADRRAVKEVTVSMVDREFAVQWLVWRSPVRRTASLRDGE